MYIDYQYPDPDPDQDQSRIVDPSAVSVEQVPENPVEEFYQKVF